MAEDGHKVPKERRKPALRGDCIDYFNAFVFLGASRQWNQVGPQPILMSEIESYLRLSGIDDPDECARFVKFVRLLDEVELPHLIRKAK